MEMTMRAGVRPDARKKVVPGFERQVAGYLDEAARTLPDDVSRRLAQARACALATISGISRVSGRFFQYFTGISDRMALVLMRAGLKILAK